MINQGIWAIQYLVINASNWWTRHNVLIAPGWIEDVRWLDKTVSVGLEVTTIKSSPAYESAKQLKREREERFYDLHGRSGYWLTEAVIARVET